MNVYDQAHNLARAIRECEEYRQYAKQRDLVNANPQLKSMIDDFQKQQIAIQAAQMAGDEVSPETMGQLQQSMQILMTDPIAAEYIQCQMRFALMMQDVFGILNEVIEPEKGHASVILAIISLFGIIL